MANDQQCTVIGSEARFDGGDGIDVEVIGRFIEDQQRRRCRAAEDAGKAGAQKLAARQSGNDLQRRVRPEHESGERCAAGILIRLRIQPSEIVADRRHRVEQADALVEHRDRGQLMNRSFPRLQIA